ncbi:AMP-binding protein [Streptosporangium soli]|nr:AMP-binding protein [Streptosporangium sp. KLBMP 9127]
MTATFADRWREAVAARPDQPFLVWEGPDGSVTRWTYAEFDALADRVAGGLVSHGVRPGRRVGLALRNSPAFVAIWIACAKLGAAMVACDPSTPTTELSFLLRRTSAVLAIRASAFPAHVPVLVVAEDDVTLDGLCGRPYTPQEPPGPGEPLGLMFTSGTTAAPKCVVVTQANYAFAGDVMAAAATLRPGDRQLVVLPMFHANAQYYSFAAAISAGASVALMHTFSASRFLTQAKRHEATHASLFAAPIRMILSRGNTPVEGLRLVNCWYAQNLTDEAYEEIADLLGCRPRQLYGMTETIPAVLTNPLAGPIPAAMGRTTLGCSVRVAEPGTCVPSREGEILVGGTPGTTLFAEYLDDPETTSASYREGWFVTGDSGTVDADGNVHFAGRGGDVLKVAGENVSIVEIETVLARHPDLFEVAVVGESDPVRDEVPVAYVVPRDGVDPSRLGELGDWCAEHLARSSRPVRFEVVEALPRTSVGKIRKFLLKR